MKNISLLQQVVTVRTSSDPSSFINKQSCYIKYSSQLNSTYVQNSSRIWNSVILISFGDSDLNLLLLRHNIKTYILMTRVCTATLCSIYMFVDLFRIQILQPNTLEHQIFSAHLQLVPSPTLVFNVGFFDSLIFKSHGRQSDIVEHVMGVVIQQQVIIYVNIMILQMCNYKNLLTL
ncbi:Hypothetical_protein [Hexamita inflata]|nr:Hypothetical protein HINF_LOCUS40562 [Hexamita inflata]